VKLSKPYLFPMLFLSPCHAEKAPTGKMGLSFILDTELLGRLKQTAIGEGLPAYHH